MSTPTTEPDTMPSEQLLSEPPPARRSGFLAALREPLRYRDFRLLFSGQLVSVFGDEFYAVALPWLVLTNGSSAQELGFVLTAYGIPRVGTVLLGGVLSDKLRPRRVMLAADSVRAVLVGILAVLALVSHPALWQLCAVAAPLGACAGLFIPASWAIAPDVLPDDTLQAGNSLSLSWTQLAGLAGPGIAGIVVSRLQSGVAFAVDAASFVVSAITLTAMRAGRTSGKHADPAAAGTTAETSAPATTAKPLTFGRFLRTSRLSQLLLALSISLNLIYGGLLEVGLPTLAKGPFHADANGYGLMLAGFGGGALVGALSGGALAHVPGRGAINLSIWGLQSIAVIFIPFAGGVPGATVALALMGICNGLGNVAFITIIQQYLPRHLMGRFMGALGFANYGLFPISVALAGFTIGHFGAQPVIVVGGMLALLVVLVSFIPRDFRGL